MKYQVTLERRVWQWAAVEIEAESEDAAADQALAESSEWPNGLSDAQHAYENDAPDTARDDRRRAKTLHKALDLLHQCQR